MHETSEWLLFETIDGMSGQELKMDTHPNEKTLPSAWIISSARYSRISFGDLGLDKISKAIREYRISMIGRYLISPEPLKVGRWLAGCEIHMQPTKWAQMKTRLWIPIRKKNSKKNLSMTLISDFSRAMIPPLDKKLGRHIQAFQNKIRPFDTLHGALDGVDIARVVDVIGICEDDAGNRSQLTIAGDTSQKLEYVRTFVGKSINVQLNRAQFAQGLFELKGFDFQRYDPTASFRLLRLIHEGVPKACVLNDDDSIAFWLDDEKLVNYLQLFELSIQQNQHMRDSLHQCIQGHAVPMRLMFNHALEIDYSRAPLPTVFKEVIGERPQADRVSQLIKENLNLHQLGVSFNSYPLQDNGDNGVRTDISIFQNLRALEPIKQQLPKLFAEMTKRASHSDAGNFYLLDAIRGGRHEA